MVFYSKEDQLGRNSAKIKKKCRNLQCAKHTTNDNGICNECLDLLNGKAKKKGKRKSKKKTAKHWRPKAKAAFQKWVRIRDADKDGICRCVTCGKAVMWNKCDGGHYRSARFNATCFDERNVHAQCKHCNSHRMDQIETLQEFERQIDLKCGKGTAKDLRERSIVTKRMTSPEYEAIYREYTQKGKDLAAQKGFKY